MQEDTDMYFNWVWGICHPENELSIYTLALIAFNKKENRIKYCIKLFIDAPSTDSIIKKGFLLVFGIKVCMLYD